MITHRASIIDDIIKNWFPVVGILFVVAGMSYLFYEGIWQQLNETGRLTLGFLSGVALISGSYPLEKTSKIISDSILAGGLLMLYVSLIFGSRFETIEQHALIPEVWALLVATLFTISVAFFSYIRQSQYILLIGIFGGYLTPFFIGQEDQMVDFAKDVGVFQYKLPLMAFLIYFLAINVAILLTANKFYLKGIGLLNTLGLFVGTISLSYFMGGQFPENAPHLAGFSVLVIALHIAAMCVSAKKFEKESDPYLIAGYLLPLVWYTAMLNFLIDPYLSRTVVSGLLFASAGIYFSGWHYLRHVSDQQQHTALYLGGILSLVMAVIKLQPYLQHYDGLIFSLAAFIFGLLYFQRPILQREMAFFLFAFFGLLMMLWRLQEMNMPSLWFLSGKTISLILAASPFLLGGKFPQREGEGESLVSFRGLGAHLAMGLIIAVVFIDLIRMEGVPRSLLILTLPALITAYVSYTTESGTNKMMLIKLSLSLAVMGFASSFLTIIGRFYPFPADVYFLDSSVCFMGLITLLLIFILKRNLLRLSRLNVEKTTQEFSPIWQFFMVFCVYTVLWATITHEIMALFNSLDIDVESEKMRGIRSFATTLWWACLAGWMIFLGVSNSALVNQKNIGFSLLSLTIFKILFIDLHHINTNLKVFVFLIVGGIMLAISFIANKHSSEEQEKEVSN
ncbi:MAG: DUF2339 domain-containing protein [Methyloprofundus sp.]|nr:DUF2339 domain-containing protein [Methyloprofundus sp.]